MKNLKLRLFSFELLQIVQRRDYSYQAEYVTKSEVMTVDSTLIVLMLPR